MDLKIGVGLAMAVMLFPSSPASAKLGFVLRKPATSVPKGAGEAFSLDALECIPANKERNALLVELVHGDVAGLVLLHWKDRRRSEVLRMKEVRRFEGNRAPRDVEVDLFRERGPDAQFDGSGPSAETSVLIGGPGEYELVSLRHMAEDDDGLPVVGSCRFVVEDVTERPKTK